MSRLDPTCDRQHRNGGRRIRHLARWLAAIVVSGTAAWLAIRQIHWIDLGDLLANVRLPLVALGLGTVLATTAFKVVRWQLLLRQSGVHASGWRALRALVIGQMGNSFLPGRVGDIARAALVASRTIEEAPTAFGTVIAEKILDGAAGTLVILGIALLSQIPGWLLGPIRAATAALVVLVALTTMVLSWPSRRFVEARISTPKWKWLREGTSRFRQGLGALATPTALLGGLGLSVVIWGMAAATNEVMLRAANARAPLWANLLVLIAVYAATFLPAVPAQIGIFEYACVLALGTAGAPADRALAFGLLLHLVVYAPPALLGPVFTALEGLRWPRGRPDDETPWQG